MADGSTPRGYTLPEVGGSVDTWGSKLNQNWEDVDGDVTDNETAAATAQSAADAAQADADTAQARADACLPKDGSEVQDYIEMGGRADVLISATKVDASTGVSGAVVLDAALANYFQATLAGNVTSLTFSNLIDVTGYAQVFIFDITSAGYTIDWSGLGTINWAYGEEPVLSTTGGRDIISLITLDGGATWTGALSQPDCQ